MAIADSSPTTAVGGAIAALAISSSVVLLALGSDKLSSLLFRRGFPHHQHCLLSSSSSESEHCRDEDEDGFEPPSSNGSDPPSSLHPLPPPASALTPFKERKERPSFKRVRFSPDVIDPAGNGQEYRRRMLRSRMPLNLKEEEEEEEEEDEEEDEDEFIQRWKHKVQINPNRKEGFRTFSRRLPASSSCRKSMPNLPANRMALYTGILRSRTEMRASYY